MTDWIDYCPSCGMPFEPYAKPVHRRGQIIPEQVGAEVPEPDALEVRCAYGHRFEASGMDRIGKSVRVKLL